MFDTRPRHLASRLQLLLAALGVAVILLLAAGTHSPGLHAWFHHQDESCAHADEPSAATEDRCAIVLFTQGVVEPIAAVFAHGERVFAEHTLAAPPAAPRPAARPHAHPPSHAPPAGPRLHLSSFKTNSRPVAGLHSTPHHAFTFLSR